MQRAVLKAVVFTLGVLLAFGIAYASQLLQRSHDRAALDAATGPPEPLVVPLPRNRPPEPPPNPLRSLGPIERRQRLELAIEEGTIDSLQLLNPQILRSFADYRTVVLPIVKEQLLKTLLGRFGERDWVDWPRAAFAERNGPSAARSFVDDVRIVNPDFGRYLETAAYLFHVLYLKSMQGSSVNLREELLVLVRNAERILANRKMRAVPARALLEPEIANDQVFLREFERKRGDFILFYASEHPNEIEKQLTLLLGLDGTFATAEQLGSIAELLRMTALSGSPRFRDRVLRLTADSPAAQVFMQRDPRVRRALAELYLVGVVDALEDRDTRRALLFLNQSIAIQPGLRTQELLAQSIKAEADRLVREKSVEAAEERVREDDGAAGRREPERGPRAGDGEPTAGEEEAAADAEESNDTAEEPAPLAVARERGSSGISYLFLFLLLVVGGGVGLMVFLYRRGVKLGAAQKQDTPVAKPAAVRMTSPSAVDFGPDQDVVNRRN